MKALTFDLFGTVLDLGGSLVPYIQDFLEERKAEVDAEAFWGQWRVRQRLEQYQDTIMGLGHAGYLETVRRAFVYALRLNGLEPPEEEVRGFLDHSWPNLSPFPEVRDALERLASTYRLVVLSNGDPEFLDHLVKNRVKWPFDAVISVTRIGAFKPHPGVYRRAASELRLEVGQCMMVSANSFDVVGGARTCGMRGTFVNRYGLPYEETPFEPDVTVGDFEELAEALGG